MAAAARFPLAICGIVAIIFLHESSTYRIRSPSPSWLGYADVNSVTVYHAKTNRPQVNTTYGPVQGVYLDNSVRGFLGVRYAAPPVGDLRWEPPQVPDKWDMYYAVRQPPACPQQCTDPPDDCSYFYLEDCLYLDIYTPPNVTSMSNLPVMMFFHGGNFRSGGSSAILYDGRFLSVLTNTVVVASNYRLGAIGFMTMKGRQTDPGLTGNYGFMDQRAAMKFIHENIAGFGGNPKKVTIFGQSAGAQSVALHLANSESDPYFQQIIVESNPFTLPYRTTFSSSLLADVTAELLNCSPGDLKCLRGKPVEDVVAAGNTAGEKIILDLFGPLHLFEPWGPVIDDKEITDNPLNAYRDGKFQNKPVMIGTVTEDGRMFIWESFDTKPSQFDVDAFFSLIFGVEEAFRIFKEYNFTNFNDLREPMSTVTTDYIFACSTLNASRSLSLASSSNIYHYIFDHAISFPKVWGPNYTECDGHVCHGSELPFVWRSVSLRDYKFNAEEQQLAESITNYWGNFAHTGDPNIGSWRDDSKPKQDFLKWPTYKESTGWQGLLFQSSENKVQSKYRDKFCRFLDKIGYTPN